MTSQKKVLVAGASGVIGQPLCKLLLQDGWIVYGTTRSENKAKMLEALGVNPIVVDVYDALKLEEILLNIKPTIVIHQLTDLPKGLDASKMEEALISNAKLRDIGTKNLVNASLKAGVQKIIAQSIAFVYEPAPLPHTEESQLLNFEDPIYGETSKAVASLEKQVCTGPFIGVVLRNGLLYGPDTGFDTPVDFVPAVHVEAAAYAAFLATNCIKNAIYNVADDDARLSTQKVKSELNWNPAFRLTV